MGKVEIRLEVETTMRAGVLNEIPVLIVSSSENKQRSPYSNLGVLTGVTDGKPNFATDITKGISSSITGWDGETFTDTYKAIGARPGDIYVYQGLNWQQEGQTVVSNDSGAILITVDGYRAMTISEALEIIRGLPANWWYDHTAKLEHLKKIS